MCALQLPICRQRRLSGGSDTKIILLDPRNIQNDFEPLRRGSRSLETVTLCVNIKGNNSREDCIWQNISSELDSREISDEISVGRNNCINSVRSENETIPAPHRLVAHDEMRRQLKYFFMNPIQKWQVKGRFPLKLTLQILKIIIVTIQLLVFGGHSYKFVKQHQDTTMTLRHIFLKDWDSLSDVIAYPPAVGPYAAYTKDEFYDNLDHVVHQFSKIQDISVGSFSYDSHDGSLTSMMFCKVHFNEGNVYSFNQSVVIDNTPKKTCVEIDSNDVSKANFSIENYLNKFNKTINFNRLIAVNLKFSLKTVYLKTLTKLDFPDCYRLNVTVKYDNTEHDGQIMISLNVEPFKLKCYIDVDFDDDGDNEDYSMHKALNFLVIAFCCLSLLLCSRSLLRGQQLKLRTTKFFKKEFGKELSYREKLEFVDFWFAMIIVNDILIISGSVIAIAIEGNTNEGDHYNKCSLLLGLGNLLVWIGVLRYLGYFHKYNMIILTLKQALPNVMRFMLCALLMYAGFCFFGWVVLGPYHIKFRTLSSTSECLFALMNGDDMFATFAILKTNSMLIWWFSRIYLYLFISLFVYVVISLFISVIMDTFETIKNIYIHGYTPETFLDVFLMEKDIDIASYKDGTQKFSFFNIRSWIPCYKKSGRGGYQRI